MLTTFSHSIINNPLEWTSLKMKKFDTRYSLKYKKVKFKIDLIRKTILENRVFYIKNYKIMTHTILDY